MPRAPEKTIVTHVEANGGAPTGPEPLTVPDDFTAGDARCYTPDWEDPAGAECHFDGRSFSEVLTGRIGPPSGNRDSNTGTVRGSNTDRPDHLVVFDVDVLLAANLTSLSCHWSSSRSRVSRCRFEKRE